MPERQDFHNRRSPTCGDKQILEDSAWKAGLYTECPAFQAEVFDLYFRRSLTYGYGNTAFQANTADAYYMNEL